MKDQDKEKPCGDSVDLLSAIRHSLAGGKVWGKLRSDGKEYEMLAVSMPDQALPYPLVRLKKPFGNHRVEDIEFILR